MSDPDIAGSDRDAFRIARNIINQIGDLYYERIPSPDWVKVRQDTNDELDVFVSGLIIGFRRLETPKPVADHAWSIECGLCQAGMHAEPVPSESFLKVASREFERVWNESIKDFDPGRDDETAYLESIMRRALQAAFKEVG